MKRFAIIICICMLASLLCACRVEDTQKPSVSVVGTETAQTTETSTEPEETQIPVEDQCALIARERESWLPEEEWYYQPYSYVVTDLDQNGRLELLRSVCEGSGNYTMTDVYEVSEDGKSLNRYYNSMGEGGSQADLIVGKTSVYYNEESGIYTYLFLDYMRAGWEWNGEEYRAISLEDEMLMEKLIVGVSNEYDMEGNCTSMYYNAVGEIIDEAGYNAAVAEYFADCVEMEAIFAWMNYDSDEALAMDAEAWERALAASYEGFSIH